MDLTECVILLTYIIRTILSPSKITSILFYLNPILNHFQSIYNYLKFSYKSLVLVQI